MVGNYNCWISGSINFKVVGPRGSIRRGSNNYESHRQSDLHWIWLDVYDRVPFELCVPVYWCLHNMAS